MVLDGGDCVVRSVGLSVVVVKGKLTVRRASKSLGSNTAEASCSFPLIDQLYVTCKVGLSRSSRAVQLASVCYAC